jgi:hypothetical protein
MLAWCIAVAQSLLIISSRKHYSVDVVVAWLVHIYLLNWMIMPCFFFPLLMYLSYAGTL